MILKLNKEAPYKKDVFRAPGHQASMKKLIHFLQVRHWLDLKMCLCTNTFLVMSAERPSSEHWQLLGVHDRLGAEKVSAQAAIGRLWRRTRAASLWGDCLGRRRGEAHGNSPVSATFPTNPLTVLGKLAHSMHTLVEASSSHYISLHCLPPFHFHFHLTWLLLLCIVGHILPNGSSSVFASSWHTAALHYHWQL